MSCKDKDGGTHHYACECREAHYTSENIRMIRAFQEIQKAMRDGASLTRIGMDQWIDAICREAIAPREKK